MEINAEKPVDFIYCLTCKHYLVDEKDDPCDICMNTFTNIWSHKPIYWEEKK